MKTILAFSCISLALVGVAFGKPKGKEKRHETTPPPEWVMNPKASYPASKFISYVGEGKNKTSAEVNAINGVAGFFSTDIESVVTGRKRMERAEASGKVANVNTAAIDSEVRKKVNVDNLVGVECNESWFDGEKTWYALAFLDKEKTVKMYRSMFEKNNLTVKTLLDVDREDTKTYYSFDTYSRIDFARDIAKRDEFYLSRLEVLSPESANLLRTTSASEKEIVAIALEIAKNIPIYVSITGDVDERLKGSIGKVLASLGFKTSENESERYSFVGGITFEPSATRDGKTSHCLYSFQCSLKDGATDTTLLPFLFNERSAAVNFELAKEKALRATESRIEKELKKEFRRYLNSIASY